MCDKKDSKECCCDCDNNFNEVVGNHSDKDSPMNETEKDKKRKEKKNGK